MSLRIPLTSDQTLQTEFHEIERRLRALEKRVVAAAGGAGTSIRVVSAGGGSNAAAVNLQPLLDRIQALEDSLADLPDPGDLDIPVFGAVGATSRTGIVPEPGVPLPPTGIAQHLLTEDATWGYPLRGLVQVMTSGNETGTGSDAVGVLGSLAVAGNLQARDIDCESVLTIDGVTLEGDAYQVTSLQRGLIAAVTDGSQTEPPYDVVSINAGLHIGHLSAADVVCNTIDGDIDGGSP